MILDMISSFPFEIANGLYVLGNKHFFTFLATGETHALIELGVSATAPLVASQMAVLGIEPEKVGYLVVPHAHFDHLGGLPYYQAFFPQARVVCSDRARKTMSNPRVLEQFFKEDDATSAWLEKTGKGQRTYSWLPGATLEAEVIVGDRDVLTLGQNNTLEFIAAPGHSPCSLAVYLPERGTLLVSDSLGFFLEPEENFPLFFYNYDTYLETIHRLSQTGASIVAAAHELIFTEEDATVCFNVAEEASRKLYRYIYAFQGNREELIVELYHRYYRNGLLVYSPQNIKACVELLVRRVKDSGQSSATTLSS